jgi:hypothetical protein
VRGNVHVNIGGTLVLGQACDLLAEVGPVGIGIAVSGSLEEVVR